MRVRGPDGRTALRPARGSRAPIRLILFGQMCRYECRSKEGDLGPALHRWNTGVWLGIERRTGQYMVYDTGLSVIRHARTLVQMFEPQKWWIDRIKEMLTTP